MAKYMVRLTQEAHQQLLTLITTGRAAAAKLLHARILLNADVGEGRRCWTDAEIAAALDTSESTVHRVRQAFVEPGWEAALARQRPTGRQYRKLDGAQEARLIALACSAPPAGRAQWTRK
jgi:transposase